jgi:hypothetical protein
LSDRALNLISVLETGAPIAALGHRRSQGIKDLAHGAAAPLPERVHHHAVVAHLGSNQMSPASLLIGDGMVHRDSAAGHAPRSDSVTVIDIPGVGHLTLLDHAQVTALLRRISEALP